MTMRFLRLFAGLKCFWRLICCCTCPVQRPNIKCICMGEHNETYCECKHFFLLFLSNLCILFWGKCLQFHFMLHLCIVKYTDINTYMRFVPFA